MQAVDPVELLAMAGDGPQPAELAGVAQDASGKLRAALDSLTAG